MPNYTLFYDWNSDNTFRHKQPNRKQLSIPSPHISHVTNSPSSTIQIPKHIISSKWRRRFAFVVVSPRVPSSISDRRRGEVDEEYSTFVVVDLVVKMTWKSIIRRRSSLSLERIQPPACLHLLIPTHFLIPIPQLAPNEHINIYIWKTNRALAIVHSPNTGGNFC